MDDSSLVRIHWLENYRFSCFLDLVGDSPCQVLESFFSASSVILCIEFYSDIVGFAFVYNEACKVLERIKCLSSLTDQDSHILAFKIDFQTAICCVIFGCDLDFSEIHGCKYIMKENRCSLFDLFDLCRISDDLDRLGYSYRFFFGRFRLPYWFLFVNSFFRLFLSDRFCRFFFSRCLWLYFLFIRSSGRCLWCRLR